MTLHSTRDGQKITIHHSPSDMHVEEDAQHVRAFYNELGKHLGEAEHERAKKQVEEHQRYEDEKLQRVQDIETQRQADRAEMREDAKAQQETESRQDSEEKKSE